MHHVLAAGFNPFDGVAPSFGPFSSVLGPKTALLLGIAWAVGFAFAAYHLIEGIARMASASRQGYSDNLSEAKRSLVMPIVAIIGLASAPIIYGVLAAS